MRRFLATSESMEDWLCRESAVVEAAGGFFKYWIHSGGHGFGLVIVGEINSGELHLMPDGDMTANVEWFNHASGKIETLWTERRKSLDMSGFDEFYASFRRRVMT